MKLAIFILGAVLATALADHKDEPSMPSMPDFNQLSNMLGGQMPQIPAGMKLDDLKTAFYNMPPSMKDKLNEMAESMGVKYDDIEEALNNPPKEIKDFFEGGATGPLPGTTDGMFNVPGAEQPQQQQRNAGPGGLDIGSLLKNVDMGAINDMMKNVDMNSLMENVDLGAMSGMLKGVDLNGIMKNVDMNMVSGMMQNMDMGAMGDIMKNMDMGAMGDMLKNVDIGGLMKNMDMGAMGDMMKNMDLGAMGNMMKGMDLGAMGNMMKGMDMGAMGNMMKGMDMGAIGGLLKNVDMNMLSGLMKNMDMGPIGNLMKNVDLKALSGLMHGKMPSLGAIKGMIGLHDGAGLKDITELVRNKMQTFGIPVENPMEAMSVIAQKMKQLPLPEGMDISPMLEQFHGQLEAMGMPEDPSMMKAFMLEKLGLPTDLKSIADLKDPEVIAQMMKKNAFKMLGLDENEDPMVVKNRIVEQLKEEAEKMGAKLPKDDTDDEMITALDKILSDKLNEIVPINTDSVMPNKLYAAARSRLGNMGLGDFGSMKKHVMDMVMKEMMKKAVPMVMNMFMPKRHHQMRMPPQMPPRMMMPPMMMMPRGPAMPLNLDIEVNVEQPQGPTMPQMPAYLRGAEQAIHFEGLDDLDDQQVFHHIMAVREGLRSGEMSEEILQEMIEDLMEARLKARVLAVRNMFLNDRLVAMEREMEMMHEPIPQMRSQISESPLLKALTRPRVL